MGIESMIMLMLMALLALAWWSNYSKRNKIYCTFNRVNKTQISKFVKMQSRYVIFDGMKFDIIPSCIVFKYWDTGLAGKVNPQWVATLDFTYGSRFPLNPNTLQTSVISPEVRKTMDKEEWVKSYARSFSPPQTRKETMIQKYLPWIIGAVAVIGIGYLYMQMQGINQNLQIQGNILDQLTR